MTEKKDGWLDPKMVSSSYPRGENNVQYWVYKDSRRHSWNSIQVPGDKNDLEVQKLIGNKYGNVCFAGLRNVLTKDHDRMQYKVVKGSFKPILTPEEEKSWIKIARSNGLLPKYVVNKVAKTGIMVIDLKQKVMSPSLLYIYLSTLRNLREDKSFVRAMVYMVEEMNVDFWPAFVIASTVCMESSGHHIMNICRQYCSTPDVNKINNIFFKDIRGLYKFIQDPMKYDKRKVYDFTTFNCYKIINSICSNIDIKLTAAEAQSPIVYEAVRAETDDEAIALLKGLGK